MANKKRKTRRSPRNKAVKANTTTAIVKIEPPSSIVVRPQFSIAPKIKQTVEDTERIRRFVSQCLNADYRRKAPEIKKQIAEIEARGRDRDLTKDEEKQVYALENKLTELEIDWGTIPGSKPFLKQPGAEKFLLWLNLRPVYHKQVTELPDGHLEMVCYCTFEVKGTKEEVFEGPECSCTTMETNFRYIWAEAQYQPNQDEVDRGYQTKMGQWRWITKWVNRKKVPNVKTWFVRIDNPNIWGERNKVRQQGQKRAQVKGVRNMGAISEIFQVGPDEWDTGPDENDDQPGSQVDPRDYTESGHQVFVDGVSPSGKAKTEEKVWEEAHNAAQDVATRRNAELEAKMKQQAPTSAQAAKAPAAAPQAAQPATPRQFKGIWTLDWSQNETWPLIMGDLANHTTELEQVCKAKWGTDSWWHIEPRMAENLRGLAEHLGYQLKEIPPKVDTMDSKPGSSAMAGPAGATGKGGGTERSAPGTRGDATNAPTVVKGIIDRVNQTTVNVTTKKGAKEGRRMAYITLLIDKRKHDYSSWDKTINEILEKALGKEAEVFVLHKGDYWNLVGLKTVAGQEYVDGKVPVMQQSQREAGGKTLFG